MNGKKLLFSRKFLYVNLVLVGVLIGLGVFVAGFASIPSASGPSTVLAENSGALSLARSDAVASAISVQEAFRQVSAALLPTTVVVEAEGVASDSTGIDPFRFFFQTPDTAPTPRPSPRGTLSTGAGVIVRKQGVVYYVLTNWHVVEGGTKISLTLSDERKFDAKLVGQDQRRDLAVLSFEPGDSAIPVAALGDSDDLKIGDWAIAVGNPLGLGLSVSTGIISALHREGGPDGNISDFIQTDASINKGNSGGALANIKGEVIGINTWIASPTGGSIGLGFAIPINNAKKVVDDLVAKGKIEYGWIGVSLADPDQASRDELGLGTRKGALIGMLFLDSPAERGGLRPGDFVIELDAKEVRSVDQLVRMVGDIPVGSKARFKVLRDGKEMSLTLNVDMRRDDVVNNNQKLWPGLSAVSTKASGIRLQDSMKDAKGVFVAAVSTKSPAAVMGLNAGDVITAVNGKKVSSLKEFYAAIRDVGVKEWSFEYLRSGEPLRSPPGIRT